MLPSSAAARSAARETSRVRPRPMTAPGSAERTCQASSLPRGRPQARAAALDLDRQALGGEQMFDQQVRVGRAFEPDLAERPGSGVRRRRERPGEVAPAPDSFDVAA
jgi:hypothetical protein